MPGPRTSLKIAKPTRDLALAEATASKELGGVFEAVTDVSM